MGINFRIIATFPNLDETSASSRLADVPSFSNPVRASIAEESFRFKLTKFLIQLAPERDSCFLWFIELVNDFAKRLLDSGDWGYALNTDALLSRSDCFRS